MDSTTQTQTQDNQASQQQVQTTNKLRDGRAFTQRRSTGRDLQQAMRIASGSETEQNMAVAAIVTSVEGRPLVYEDFLDMDLADCGRIVMAYSELMGK